MPAVEQQGDSSCLLGCLATKTRVAISGQRLRHPAAPCLLLPPPPLPPQAVGKGCGIWVVPIVGGISQLKQERLLSKHPEVGIADVCVAWG